MSVAALLPEVAPKLPNANEPADSKSGGPPAHAFASLLHAEPPREKKREEHPTNASPDAAAIPTMQQAVGLALALQGVALATAQPAPEPLPSPSRAKAPSIKIAGDAAGTTHDAADKAAGDPSHEAPGDVEGTNDALLGMVRPPVLPGSTASGAAPETAKGTKGSASLAPEGQPKPQAPTDAVDPAAARPQSPVGQPAAQPASPPAPAERPSTAQEGLAQPAHNRNAGTAAATATAGTPDAAASSNAAPATPDRGPRRASRDSLDHASDAAAPQAAGNSPIDKLAGLAPGHAQGSAGDAKPMTGVNDSSIAGKGAEVDRTHLQEAAASATNQAILRRAASGEIHLPDLGRVAVRADSAAGAVNVNVSVDRADTHAALHAAGGAMAADLRQADVPLGHLRFERAGGHTTHADTSGGHGTPAHDTPKDGRQFDDQEDGDEPAASATPGRVRIVL